MSKKYIRNVEKTSTKRKKPRLEVQTESSEMLEDPAPISPKMASSLHKDQMPSLSFLEAPLQSVSTRNYNGYFSDDLKTFGVEQHEAYIRDAYVDLGSVITNNYGKLDDDDTYLAIVQGSSGVGKSVFLAYFLARLRYCDYKNFALFHAPKDVKQENGKVDLDRVLCSIWIDGKKEIHGEERFKRQEICSRLKDVEVVFMDGCSMMLNLRHYGFRGLIVLSASPSQYFTNLTAAYPSSYAQYYMPPAPYDEALKIANTLHVNEDVVTENYQYMNGILRYLFKKGAAKSAVAKNVTNINPKHLIKIVTNQSEDKELNKVAVHALLVWDIKTWQDQQGEGEGEGSNVINANGRVAISKESSDISEPQHDRANECSEIHDEEQCDALDAVSQHYETQPAYKIVSDYAEKLVAKALAQLQMEEIKDTFIKFSANDATKAYEGALFEAYAIRTIQNGGTFKLQDFGNGNSFDLKIDPLDFRPVESAKLTKGLLPYDSLPCETVDGQKKLKPLLLWPTIPNFPTFDCFYYHGDGTVYCLQMTIAEAHDLKNSGAKMAKEYFDGMYEYLKLEKPEKYKAVFVVPHYSELNTDQPFTSKNTKTATIDQSAHFEQWKIVLPK